MSSSDLLWIGADPGGKGNFGLAILRADSSCRTCLVDYVDEAIDFIRGHMRSMPTGVGVDAPLWWCSGVSGLRKADQWIRDEYQLPNRNVQAVNSLWGSVLVQGMMFVTRIRELFPDVGVTETHPKALLKALRVDDWGDFSRKFLVNVPIRSDHERDAIISAVAAREGFEGRWLHDLSTTRHPSEQDPSKFWLAPIHYFWPE